MKRLSLLLCTILFVQTLSAQVLNYDMIERNANTNVKLTLKDSKSSKPVSWASVYLIPAGDTTITHFTLSDDKGDVVLKEVPVGKYELNAEIIGYNPHKKVYTIKAHWDAYDLGVIRMEENAEYLEASTVSAIGNPVVVKKDTIEYTASSFKTSDNDMLEELLKKLPGVEVAADGSITANGETITKIMIDGKPFFLDDPQLASKNIPAKMIEKIKVVEKKSDQALFTGIDDGEEEMVIDLSVKPGMMDGWFGNTMVGGGHDVPGGGSDMNDPRFQAAATCDRITEDSVHHSRLHRKVDDGLVLTVIDTGKDSLI